MSRSGKVSASGTASLVSLLCWAGPVWADDFAAIAFSQDSGAVGYSNNYQSRQGAERRAMKECGSGCEVVVWFSNGCGALATGDDNGYGSGWASNRSEAERIATASCSKNAKNCSISRWVCTDTEFAQAQNTPPAERTAKPPNTLSRSVDSGAEAVVARSTFWNSSCQPRPFKLTVTKQPTNGSVTVKEGLNPVTDNPRFGTAGSCAGKETIGKQIVYRSKAGFRGEDVVNYEVVSDKGEKATTTIAITVK